jgi:radical SAM-linked protein
VVQRIRIRYAKRGPLRFTSHRDFARAFERAVQRAGVPIAYSQGFTPHPKISYASAAPTGVASEAEYLEIALREYAEPAQVAAALDAALSPGLDVLTAVEATGGSLADRMEASLWRIELPGVAAETAGAAAAAFLAHDEVLVERMTKQGRRTFDARAAVLTLALSGAPQAPSEAGGVGCAILESVVRQVTPAVRPDDVLTGLRLVAGLEPAAPPRVTRLRQGTLSEQAEIGDPLLPSHDGVAEAEETVVGASPA